MVEKYKLIKDFLTKDETDIFRRYCLMKHRVDDGNMQEDDQAPLATSNYGDPAMESLMLNKKNKLEKIINLKLLPTYSYWRIYVWDQNLKDHTDRPSCEISITVHFGSDGKEEWPIYMGDTPIILQPGDAVVYKGCEINHKRDHYKGDWYAQAFLHYVDANGPNQHLWKDERAFWGTRK